MPRGIYKHPKQCGFQKGHKLIGGGFTGKHHSGKSRIVIGLAGKGRKHTQKWKDDLRENAKINPNYGMKGKKHSEKARKKMRESQIHSPNRKFKETSIELKVEAELQKRNINYQKQVPLCKIAIVDFYLPEYRIVIQCDGDYWHNLKGKKETAERQDKVLTFNGFNVYRFWEHEINKSVEECLNKININ